MQIIVIIQFSSIFEPNDFWSRLALSNANENNFMTKYVFIVEVRSLSNACSLKNIIKYAKWRIIYFIFRFWAS